MAYVNYYLDKPYNPAKDKSEVKAVVSECIKNKRHYPKSILNPTPTTLYLFFTITNGSRLKFRTPIKVLPELWDFRKGRYKSSAAGSIELNLDLDNLSSTLVKTFLRSMEDDKDEKTIVEVKNQLAEIIKGRKIIRSMDLLKVQEEFLERKKDLLSKGTLQEYKTVFKSLKDFAEAKKEALNLDSFNQSFFEEYEGFLITKENPKKPGQGLLNDTIAKYTATLKTFLQWGFENGFHKNVLAFSNIKTRIKKRAKNDIVTLTELELKELLEYDFSGNSRLEKVRDIFCFGCFTGQRFSDIMNFNYVDFDGQTWDFISLKNKKRVIVPMSGFISGALPILAKYPDGFPKISNQKFNDYLKEIGEHAELNKLVKIIRYSGVQTVERCDPKYEFMSSHMARRTFVTLSLEKGVPITIIQKITQHSDLRTLIKYEGHSEQAIINSFKNT